MKLSNHSQQRRFGAFVMQASKLRLDKAVAVSMYVESREDQPFHVRDRIRSALSRGLIQQAYFDRLMRYLDACVECYMGEGRVMDVRDARDWEKVGNGFRHRTHGIEDPEDARFEHGVGRGPGRPVVATM
jgi:hypothetical protein